MWNNANKSIITPKCMKRKGKRFDSVLWQKPLRQQNCQKGKVTTQTKPQKRFDYTAVADRLRTVSWSSYGHQTGVVYRFYRAHLRTHRNSRAIEGKNRSALSPYITLYVCTSNLIISFILSVAWIINITGFYKILKHISSSLRVTKWSKLIVSLRCDKLRVRFQIDPHSSVKPKREI